MIRMHTATHCHCGSERGGSDHCPECGCEEFEGTCDHVHVVNPTFVVIHGMLTSTKTAVDYVSRIVYGHPRIEAVTVGSHFVAICEFSGAHAHWAKGTFDRMGSFPHGASMAMDKATALTEFGSWAYHYAPGTFVQ